MKKFLSILAVAALALVAVSCNKDEEKEETVALKSIELSKTTLNLQEGEEATLTVVYNPSDATEKPAATWSSSDAGVATVAEGKVKAVAAGTATITAKVGALTATCSVTVTSGGPEPIPLTGIELNPATLDLEEGGEATLTVVYKPENASEKPAATWSSSDTGVATVDEGKVTAVAAGTATITAKVGELTATCAVTVTAAEVDPVEIVMKTYAQAGEGFTASWEPVTGADYYYWQLIEYDPVTQKQDYTAYGATTATSVTAEAGKDVETSDVEFVAWLADFKEGCYYFFYLGAYKGEGADEDPMIGINKYNNYYFAYEPTTQPVTPLSISEIFNLEKGTECVTTESLVVAKTTKGVVITDGVKSIYVFGDKMADVKVGDKVVVSASKTVYNGVHELEKVSEVEVKSSGNTVTYPTPKDITAEAETYAASEAEFVSLTGTLSISGNYYNLNLANTTAKVGSIVYPVADLGAAGYDGKKITITGYFNGLSGSNKYINVITVQIDEVQGPADPTVTASDIKDVPAEGVTDATATVTIANAEGWTVRVDFDGTVVTTASLTESTLTYTVSANETQQAREGSITIHLIKDSTDLATTIKVTQKAAEAPVDPNAIVFDFTAQGYQNAQVVESLTVSDFTVSFSKGTGNNDPKYYNSGTAVRAYAGNQITVTAPSGVKIASIAFTFSSGEGANAILVNEGTFESPTWTGSANPVVFTIDGSSGHRRIAKMVVVPAEKGGNTGGVPDYDPIGGFEW